MVMSHFSYTVLLSKKIIKFALTCSQKCPDFHIIN